MQRTGLDAEFWQAVDDVLAQIEAKPFRFGKSEFATEELDFRFAIVKRFKYVIHFAVDAEEVQVASVSHAERKPGNWLRRCRK